jgi:hypothetical protein
MMVLTQARMLGAAVAVALLLGSAPRAAQPAKLDPLRGIEALKAWFNANQGHPRTIFLLSPT